MKRKISFFDENEKTGEKNVFPNYFRGSFPSIKSLPVCISIFVDCFFLFADLLIKEIITAQSNIERFIFIKNYHSASLCRVIFPISHIVWIGEIFVSEFISHGNLALESIKEVIHGNLYFLIQMLFQAGKQIKKQTIFVWSLERLQDFFFFVFQ